MLRNDVGWKRGRSDAANRNGAVPSTKRSKGSTSNQPDLGNKTKPCTKFFSTSRCPFGEGCRFLHSVPGRYSTAVAQITNRGITALSPASRNPIEKNRLCKNYNTEEGCKFSNKCNFAHGESELGRPLYSGHQNLMAGTLGGGLQPPPPRGHGPTASFGASSTAKITVDAALSDTIIGNGGANIKQICCLTGAKLFITEHDSDPNLRNIDLEGTFDQIMQATGMVQEMIANISTTGAAPVPLMPTDGFGAGGGGPGSNIKTEMCNNFIKGSCNYGDRCNFAHGDAELRMTAT